jgi:hypothetical protein
MQGEARLRGLWRMMHPKTIRPRLCKAKPACAGYGGLFLQRPSFRSLRGKRDVHCGCPSARFRRSVDRNSFRSPRGKRDVHCGCPSARFRRSVDRNSFRSPRGKCDVHCGCPGSVRPYPSGITRRAARSSLRVLRLPAIPRTLPVLPPVVVLRASRRRVKRALLPAARVHVQNRRRCR